MYRRTFRIPHVLFVLAVLCASPTTPASGQDSGGATVVYLVRHAERAEDGTSDPPISSAGEARAELLARMLRDANLTAIHTTAYRRTRATGGPTAQKSGLTMSEYDGGDLEGLARRIHAAGGHHLVVGHSNTTPALVEALGGEPGTEIDEAEYDRLYIVTLTPGATSTVLLRFGSPPGG